MRRRRCDPNSPVGPRSPTTSYERLCSAQVGCRRPTPGNGYLEALCSENTEVVSESIAQITPKGIMTADGVEHEVDVIVCATGFDVSWRPSYPTIGKRLAVSVSNGRIFQEPIFSSLCQTSPTTSVRGPCELDISLRI